MKSLIRHIVCLLAASVFIGVAGAADRLNVLSENIRMNKQMQLLESIITEDEDANHLTHDLYGNFPDSLVNPYKIALAQVPDSMRFDCSDYVAPIENVITSRFGQRGRRFHYGIDIKLNIGDTIASAFDGQVRTLGYDKYGYGYYMVVRHNNGLETVYGHLSGYIAERGDIVKAGHPIALGGNTGRSTGPHLHFETRFLGHPIDPERLIDFELFVPKQDNYLMVKANDFKYQTIVVRYYTVKQGDTLSRIAARTGTSVAQLRKLNKLGQNAVIRPGQKIRYS